MKKKYAIFIIIVLVISIIVSIKPIIHYSFDLIIKLVEYQWDKEEEERARKVEKGELIQGKDTILIWCNMYEIGHFCNGNHLSISSPNIDTNILEKINRYRIINNKLYVTSDDGCAVIDDSKICRIYIHSQKEVTRIENEYVTYLSQYEDFSEQERHIFKKKFLYKDG